MKRWFRDTSLGKKSLSQLDVINDIITEYKADGYKLTLRQLYYQLVSRIVIVNSDAEYGKLSRLLKEGRMAGLVDWDAIEDRLRIPKLPYCNENVTEAIEDAELQYRLDRQEGQSTYIEVWVEKDALSSVLERVTRKYHVRLLVNRGYGSVTAIHDAYKRFSSKIKKGQDCIILYLGDLDPSGVDMIRDITDRVSEMLESDGTEDLFVVESIALTIEQVRKYNPPENPAKLSDTRARKYIVKYGKVSWEMDALKPQVLTELLTEKIEENMDMELYDQILRQEEEDKKKLRIVAKKFKEENE